MSDIEEEELDKLHGKRGSSKDVALLIIYFFLLTCFLYYILGLFALISPWIRTIAALAISASIIIIFASRKPEKALAGKNAVKSIYSNIMGSIIFFILGGSLMVIGVIVGLIFSSPFAFMFFGSIGVLTIFLASWVRRMTSERL